MLLLCFLAIYFITGACSLVYQTVWQRVLTQVFGADIYSASTVVAAFMAGLGLGALFGGRLADRFSVRMSIACYAIFELSAGIFGFFSIAILLGVAGFCAGFISPHEVGSSWYIALLFCVTFALVFIPTFLMGATLPLLSRALVTRVELVGRTIGWLYGVNTLGAAAGALCGGYVLMSLYGMKGAVAAAAYGNVIAACVCAALLAIYREAGHSSQSEQPAQLRSNQYQTDALTKTDVAWAVAIGVSGLIALGYEMAWFRLLQVMIKSNAYVFSTLLFYYLLGLALGSSFWGSWVKRVRSPRRLFCSLQLGIGLWVFLSVCCPYYGEGHLRVMVYLKAYFMRHVPLDLRDAPELWKDFLLIYVLLPSWLMLVPTFLMGGTFPVINQMVSRKAGAVGRRVGFLYFCNIVGAICGAILTGFFLLRYLHTSWTLRIFIAMNLSFMLFLPLGFVKQRVGVLIRAIVVLFSVEVVFLLFPMNTWIWELLHSAKAGEISVREGVTGVAVLKKEQSWDCKSLFINGSSHCLYPPTKTHLTMGHIPLLIHPDPRDICVVGIGGGVTANAIATHKFVRSITCVEIQHELLPLLREASEYTSSILHHPGFELIIADGRSWLSRTERKFDIIQIDALIPQAAGSGNIYSREFFEICRSRLKPRGFLMQWANDNYIKRTVAETFPYVYAIGTDELLIGSNDRIVFDAAKIRSHILATSVSGRASLLRVLDNKAERMTPQYIIKMCREVRGELLEKCSSYQVNTDLFPRSELYLFKRE